MNNFKKLFLTAVCLLVTAMAALAQDQSAESSQPQQPKPFKVYCQLVSYNAFFSSKINVDFDFGQVSNFWDTGKGLVDENGKSLKFNNMVDALNYLGERGWELVDRYYEQIAPDLVQKDEAPKHYWILCKTVTSKEEILEGLITYGQYKAMNP